MLFGGEKKGKNKPVNELLTALQHAGLQQLFNYFFRQ